MSEHEFWNELGNLYLISGAYEPAIHAYARSIEMERGFGRPYSNMALAFVHTGKYSDAIELYHRSIELLTDSKEKAITWNRLGILYRQIKDYQAALVAYEQADKLDSRQDEKREQASRDVKYPLSVAMPSIDLQSILERKQEEEVVDENLFRAVNDELEVAETQHELQWFDGDFVPPNPAAEPAIVHSPTEQESLQRVSMSVEQELLHDISLSMVEEGWIPLVLEDMLPIDEIQMSSEQSTEETGGSADFTAAWQAQAEQPVQENENDPAGFAAVYEVQAGELNPEVDSENQWVEVNDNLTTEDLKIPTEAVRIEISEDQAGYENQWAELSGNETIEELNSAATIEPVTFEESQPAFEGLPMVVNEEQTLREPQDDSNESTEETIENQPAFDHVSVMVNDYQAGDELVAQSDEGATEAEEQNPLVETGSYAAVEMEVTEAETVEYSQIDYPLIELTPAEIDSIQIDIARFKRIIQINPRNAFAWDTLGGLYKSLGKFKDAITAYQQAIALDSTKPSYFYQMGLMYSAERRDDEAMDAFQRVLSLDPDHILAHASLGSHYRKMGLNDLAQQHIDIALKDVYEEENEYNQACLEAICGNTDRALELLQVAIEENPSYINWAQHDPDLDAIRHDQRFYILIQSFAQNR